MAANNNAEQGVFMQTLTQTGNTPDKTEFQTLGEILKGEYIKPVYQPVVSLTDGEIYGYEALSRITDKEYEMDIVQMFETAARMNVSLELERLCGTKSLENAACLAADKKLFLNLDPNIIHNKEFKDGFTKSRLSTYGSDFDNIVLEITERSVITEPNAFLKAIEHYKSQNYKIAIDDVGAGYSGFGLLMDVKPDFIKLDMKLIRDIGKDETKRLLCKAIIDFGKNIGIGLIAEGIEAEDELKSLIGLGVDFGQGFFIGMPKVSLDDIAPEKTKMIKKYYRKIYNKTIKSSIYPIIERIAKPGHTFYPDENAVDIYERLQRNPEINEFAVIENDAALGVMTKAALNEIFGGRYGYSLNSRNKIRKLLEGGFLRVNGNMPIDQVSRLAMKRPVESLYNPVVVEKAEKYLGIVTIKDLLDACTKIEIETAMQDKLQAERDAYNSEIAKERVDAARKAVVSSIEYASRIQKNLLPDESLFKAVFSDYSIIWSPRDIVGGDIYWIKNFEEGTVLCVCDCTGHGVPGALLTMLVVSVFEAEVSERNYKDTAQIMLTLEQKLVNVLHMASDLRIGNNAPTVNDGCDLAVLYISKDTGIDISAGNTNVFICDGDDVTKIKGQKIFIGEGSLKNKADIKTVNIPANPKNKYYIASDGLFDQLGGGNILPFGYYAFKDIILKNHNENQSIISQKIWSAFIDHMGAQTRIDDAQLITFKPDIQYRSGYSI